MREILFRGKRKVCDEWVYGFPFISRKGEYKIKWYDAYYGSSKTSEIYTESIGQFTGLTDKNGKKIFEGDIVRCISMTDMANMVVIFEDGEFRMVLCENYKDYIPGCGFYAIRCFDKEVIGNIHDNPELLENP